MPNEFLPCEYYKLKEEGHGAGIDCYDYCGNDSNCIDEGHCENNICVPD